MKMLFAIRRLAPAICVLGIATPGLYAQGATPQTIQATSYNSHFPAAAKPGESFNGIGVASNGDMYYVISSDKYNIPGQMYSFDPATKTVTHIAGLNAAVGQGDKKEVAQGKSHVDFMQDGDKLYFTTHLGYYQPTKGGVERLASSAPNGYGPYPGGHFMTYDLKTGKFTSLAMAPGGQGIIAFNMDKRRGRLYGITWPYGDFLTYDLKTKELKNLGTKFHGGEMGKLGSTYRAICRRIALDPLDGSAYFTTGDGNIYRYDYDKQTVNAVKGVNLRKDYFGKWNPSEEGMAYNWRAAVWVPSEKAIYAINGASGYLFRFDPSVPSVEVLKRLTSVPAKRSGMYGPYNYGYLGLVLGPDGHTLYYMTAAPLPKKREHLRTSPKEKDGTHLITYDIATGKYEDHGAIVFQDDAPMHPPQSLAMGLDGTLYTLAFVMNDGKRGIDLVSFHP